MSEQKRSRLTLGNLNSIEKAAIGLALVFLIVSSVFVASWAVHKEANPTLLALEQDVGKLTAALKIEVRDPAGNLKASRCKDDDLSVSNFHGWLAALFTEAYGQNVVIDTAKNVSGATIISGFVKTLTVDSGGYMFATCTGAAGPVIAVGNGTNAPTTSDYSLQTMVENYTIITPAVYANGNVTFSAAITMTATRDISESGVFLRWGGVSNYIMMIFRDTFSPVTTNSGDAITITYTIGFAGTGFTNNFGYVLAGVFQWAPAASEPTVTLYDIANSSQTFTIYGDTQTYWLFDPSAGVSGTSGIQVGTGSQAFALNDYSLQTGVESIASNSKPQIGANNITGCSTIVMTATRTITEAGYFLKGINTTMATKTYMVWRKVFAGVEVPINTCITITFKITA